MSSKKCLALHREELIQKINTHKVQFRYDATVGGCIPICSTFANMSGVDEVTKMFGIVNASTNYLLT